MTGSVFSYSGTVEISRYEIHQGTSQKVERQKYEWLHKN